MPADFRATQQAFTDWLRDPGAAPAPAGVESRRLAIYRELFLSNVTGFIDNAYPLLKGLTEPAEWQRLCHGFFARHRCHTPYFREIACEFLDYLETQESGWLAARPWRHELARFEWTEMAAEFAGGDALPAGTREAGDLLADIPVPAPALWVLACRWPVHTFTAGTVPAAEAPALPTCLLLFRDAADGVQTLEVNALAARLVEHLLEDGRRCGRALLEAVAAEAGLAADAAFLAAGADLLQQLHAAGVIRGMRAATTP
jgi:hypothetical protein